MLIKRASIKYFCKKCITIFVFITCLVKRYAEFMLYRLNSFQARTNNNINVIDFSAGDV